MSAAPDFILHSGYALRELDEDDADELHALIERNRERLARWIQWARDQSRADTSAFIARAREKEQDDTGLSRGVIAGGRLAGVVGITVDPANRSGAIGYWLDERSEGNGVVTAAVAALVDDAFDRWQLQRVEIRADIANLPSCAVAERLGFEREGVLRQAYRVEGERFSDDAVYSLLKSDPARRALAGRSSAA